MINGFKTPYLFFFSSERPCKSTPFSILYISSLISWICPSFVTYIFDSLQQNKLCCVCTFVQLSFSLYSPPLLQRKRNTKHFNQLSHLFLSKWWHWWLHALIKSKIYLDLIWLFNIILYRHSEAVSPWLKFRAWSNRSKSVSSWAVAIGSVMVAGAQCNLIVSSSWRRVLSLESTGCESGDGVLLLLLLPSNVRSSVLMPLLNPLLFLDGGVSLNILEPSRVTRQMLGNDCVVEDSTYGRILGRVPILAGRSRCKSKRKWAIVCSWYPRLRKMVTRVLFGSK